MDYLYENLGDERFQEFCQCLINKEFPNCQSFPVGQPDGGRDSLVYFPSSTKKEFFVFQVKYVRNINKMRDVHKWFVGLIQDEIEKINRLIPRGARHYFLVTNVGGTAHLDDGTIDKLNKFLEDNVKIPSTCWWRDDLSRKFESDPMFKWSFPEILTGQDFLNMTLFRMINENKEKRENAIKAYLADQYKIDNEVKFRQIDLQNKLLDLFTDVPIRVKKYNENNKVLKRTLGKYQKRLQFSEEPYWIEGEDDAGNVGAAEFILNPKIQSDVDRLLLEGGPGQGKSTIAQYVCQANRIRLLNKNQDSRLLPEKIKSSPVRLPFKIDLRHVAAWVEKRNPYENVLSEQYFNGIWSKSLESFLVAHVFYHSQVDGFSSGDFVAICKISPILFVFDGFDEVADLKVREEVVDFINKGINRLSENSISIQVLITSRPAAFSDSIGFSVDQYPHFELTDLTIPIIKEYVDKWTKASRLDSRESSELKKTVEEKLNMPHLRGLAKTPMQLAIFISLLRTRGESLPNKRTALYDSYVELFFNRESEKNSIIRDYRDLIIDIHQYLAWILHSEAELYKNSGIIHIDDLKSRINEYLKKEGHKTDITDKLFKVVEERVCALVSRVQGTFEFEVQPLREYFCAKFLYKTAPYSPTGAEKLGSKPDRFEAVSRNFYWQNVTRFFAGCFDKGELSMLIQKIKELQGDEILKFTNYPRLITSQLLSDYVFTQYPLLLKDVVKIIVDAVNIGNILNQESARSSEESIVLPAECGRDEVVNECFNQLREFPPVGYAAELIGLIVNNPYKTIEIWCENYKSFEGDKLTMWLEYAYNLQIIHRIDESILLDIIWKDPDDSNRINERLKLIINGNRLDIVDKNINLKSIVLRCILEREILVYESRMRGHSFEFLTWIFNHFLLAHSMSGEGSNLSMKDYFDFRIQRMRDSKESFLDLKVNDDVDRKIEEYMLGISEALNMEVSYWRSNIEPWDIIVEIGRAIFGDCLGLYGISLVSAGLKSKEDIGDDFRNLCDSQKSLCKRVRYARMKSGNVKYWGSQLAGSGDKGLVILVMFAWATPKTIIQLLPVVEPIIQGLSINEYSSIANCLNICHYLSKYNKIQEEMIEDAWRRLHVCGEVKYLMSFRVQDKNREKYIFEHVEGSERESNEIISQKLFYAMKKYLKNTENEDLLGLVRNLYKAVSMSQVMNERYWYLAHGGDSVKIPFNIAKKIMSDCKSYPRAILFAAEKSCRLVAYEKLKPVGKIAEEDGWF